MRMPLLPERPPPGPQPLGSAGTSQFLSLAGQLVLTIEHQTIRGVTPAMLRWGFEHILPPLHAVAQAAKGRA